MDKRRLAALIAPLVLAAGLRAQETPRERVARTTGWDLEEAVAPPPVSVPLTGKACFCEAGGRPASQSAIFVLGCKAWLAARDGCASKRVVEEGYDYSGRIPAGTALVEIGYVGHWNGSEQFVKYLSSSVTPLLIAGYSVAVDNTACGAMKEPVLVDGFVRGLSLRPGQTLEVKGNQTTSVGKFDALLGKNMNFYAKVSSRAPGVILPECGEFRGANCLIQAQGGETGRCREAGATRELRCCRRMDETSHGFGEEPVKTVWEDPEECGSDDGSEPGTNRSWSKGPKRK